MTLPAHWVLATGNRGKLAELSALLGEAGLDVRVTAPTDANRILPLNFFGGRTLTATASFMRENL